MTFFRYERAFIIYLFEVSILLMAHCCLFLKYIFIFVLKIFVSYNLQTASPLFSLQKKTKTVACRQ